MADLNTPPTPVPAATIMLLRERDEQLQVFMVVRHHQIDFASGALVFPGGKVDAQDFDNELLPYLTDAHDVADMRAIQVSAIREAFEECGVLLAYDKVASAAQGQNVSAVGGGPRPVSHCLLRRRLDYTQNLFCTSKRSLEPPRSRDTLLRRPPTSSSNGTTRR